MSQAAFFRCIGEPTRLQIMHLIAGGEMCVGDIANLMNKAQPLISHHLKALKHCNIVVERQEAQKVFYRLSDARLACFVRDVQSMMAELSLCNHKCENEEAP